MLLIIMAILVGGGAALWKSPRSRNVIFLCGIVVGLLFSWLGFVFYLVKHNYYTNIVSNLLYIPRDFWRLIFSTGLTKDVYIDAMTFGTVLFQACVLFYALGYTKILFYHLYHIKSWVIYTILSLFWVLECICFLPSIYQLPFVSYEQQNQLSMIATQWAGPFFRVFNILCLVAAVLILLYDFYSQRKVVSCPRALLYNFLIFLCLVVIFCVLFSWMPTLMMRPTMIRNYYTFYIPDIAYSIRLINFFPGIFLILMTLVFYFAYKYKEALNYSRNVEISFDRSMQVASKSMRIYAHAMKNQLAVIQSEVEYLQEMVQDEESKYSIKLIMDACHSALTTIDTGVTVLNRRQIQMKPTLISEPVNAALKEKQLLLKNVNVQTSYPSAVPSVFLDIFQIKEVLCNLLTNAVDAISAAARTDAGEISISVHTHSKWVVISLADNGCGMEETTGALVFEPFFSTKSSSTNWGMGLSLCQKIMAAHRGTISLSSVPGEGTRFDLAFPII